MNDALLIFNIFNTFAIFEYFRLTHGWKYEKNSINIAIVLVFYAIHTTVNLRHEAMTNIISEFVLINVFGFLFFKEKAGKFYFNAIYQFYLLSLDLSFTGISALINNIEFTKMQIDDSFIPYVAVNFVVVLFTYRKVIKLFQYDFIFFADPVNRKILAAVMILQFLFVLSISCFYDIYITSLIGIIVMLYISIVNTGSIFLLLYMQRSKEMKEQARISQMQNVALYDSIVDKNALKDALIDVLKRHLPGCHKRKGTQAELDEHVAELHERFEKLTNKYECGNEMINAVVNTAIMRAETNQIKFKEDASIINWDFIDKIDSMTILSNLLNNAIESAGRLVLNRGLELVIRKKGEFVMIKITNSCDPNLVEKVNERLYQTKDETIYIRTNLAVDTIKKNRGQVKFKLEENQFIIEVRLPVNK